MQTFLPYPSLHQTARSLDPIRLNKQCVEALQIWLILAAETEDTGFDEFLSNYANRKRGWYNHPAITMWRGSHNLLALYYRVLSAEWLNMGNYRRLLSIPILGPLVWPWWWGDTVFHYAHRANLLYKKPGYYAPIFGEPIPRSKPVYYWPTEVPGQYCTI